MATKSFLGTIDTIVKNILFILLLVPLLHQAQSDPQFYNNGSAIYIQQSGLLHIQGGIVNSNSDSVANVANDGTIEITGNFENKPGAHFGVNTNNTSKDRVVKFVGSGTQYIKGDIATAGKSSFYNLVVDKANASDTVQMQTPLVVEGSLVFGTANTTTTYNPSSTYTNNDQKGLFKTFDDSMGEFVVDIQNGNPDAISGYPVLAANGYPTSGYILTSGIRGSANGGIQRKISSATSYTFPVGTRDKGFNGVTLNFSQIPGNGSVKMKFCSNSSNPNGNVGSISTYCNGCNGNYASPTDSGYNRYFTNNECNGGAPQWLILNNTAQNFGYWSFESTNTGYSYDMEVFPNSVDMYDLTRMWRVIKHEDKYGADPSLASVDWMSEIDSLVATPNDLLTYTKNAGCYSGSGIPGGTYKDFSHFTLGTGGSGEALPVTLLFLKAENMGKHHVKVSWATALEINNHGFEIWRSTDGVNFTNVGWVDGHNNSTVTENYSFDDRVPQSTTYYYKLKQVDNNGKFVYSNIAEVQMSDGGATEADFRVYPNPTTNDIFLDVRNPSDQVKVVIYDMSGQAAYNNIFTVEQTGSDQTFTVNASALLKNGTYIISATTNGAQFNSKFVLQ